MIRVVIDTNVLISAALRDRDPEKLILSIAAREGIEWLVSSDIRREFDEVIARPKFSFPDALLIRWTELIRSSTTLVDLDVELPHLCDRKDAKFLSCAVAGAADLLMTGDRDFDGLSDLGTLRIVSVARAMEVRGVN